MYDLGFIKAIRWLPSYAAAKDMLIPPLGAQTGGPEQMNNHEIRPCTALRSMKEKCDLLQTLISASTKQKSGGNWSQTRSPAGRMNNAYGDRCRGALIYIPPVYRQLPADSGIADGAIGTARVIPALETAYSANRPDLLAVRLTRSRRKWFSAFRCVCPYTVI